MFEVNVSNTSKVTHHGDDWKKMIHIYIGVLYKNLRHLQEQIFYEYHFKDGKEIPRQLFLRSVQESECLGKDNMIQLLNVTREEAVTCSLPRKGLSSDEKKNCNKWDDEHKNKKFHEPEYKYVKMSPHQDSQILNPDTTFKLGNTCFSNKANLPDTKPSAYCPQNFMFLPQSNNIPLIRVVSDNSYFDVKLNDGQTLFVKAKIKNDKWVLEPLSKLEGEEANFETVLSRKFTMTKKEVFNLKYYVNDVIAYRGPLIGSNLWELEIERGEDSKEEDTDTSEIIDTNTLPEEVDIGSCIISLNKYKLSNPSIKRIIIDEYKYVNIQNSNELSIGKFKQGQRKCTTQFEDIAAFSPPFMAGLGINYYEDFVEKVVPVLIPDNEILQLKLKSDSTKTHLDFEGEITEKLEYKIEICCLDDSNEIEVIEKIEKNQKIFLLLTQVTDAKLQYIVNAKQIEKENVSEPDIRIDAKEPNTIIDFVNKIVLVVQIHNYYFEIHNRQCPYKTFERHEKVCFKVLDEYNNLVGYYMNQLIHENPYTASYIRARLFNSIITDETIEPIKIDLITVDSKPRDDVDYYTASTLFKENKALEYDYKEPFDEAFQYGHLHESDGLLTLQRHLDQVFGKGKKKVYSSSTSFYIDFKLKKCKKRGLSATPDGFVFDENNKLFAVVEVKSHISKRQPIGRDGYIPERYNLQLQAAITCFLKQFDNDDNACGYLVSWTRGETNIIKKDYENKLLRKVDGKKIGQLIYLCLGYINHISEEFTGELKEDDYDKLDEEELKTDTADDFDKEEESLKDNDKKESKDDDDEPSEAKKDDVVDDDDYMKKDDDDYDEELKTDDDDDDDDEDDDDDDEDGDDDDEDGDYVMKDDDYDEDGDYDMKDDEKDRRSEIKVLTFNQGVNWTKPKRVSKDKKITTWSKFDKQQSVIQSHVKYMLDADIIVTQETVHPILDELLKSKNYQECIRSGRATKPVAVLFDSEKFKFKPVFKPHALLNGKLLLNFMLTSPECDIFKYHHKKHLEGKDGLRYCYCGYDKGKNLLFVGLHSMHGYKRDEIPDIKCILKSAVLEKQIDVSNLKIIVAGDFNRAFTDAGIEIVINKKKFRLKPCVSYKTSTRAGEQNIDNVLTNLQISEHNVKNFKSPFSDHKPVMATLTYDDKHSKAKAEMKLIDNMLNFSKMYYRHFSN